MHDSQTSDIRRDFERVAPDIVREAAKFQAAILADVAGPPRHAATGASRRSRRR